MQDLKMSDPLEHHMYCAQQINIPLTFPYILKAYVKAAIRTQPYDLLRWTSAYFRELANGDIPPAKVRLEYPPFEHPSKITPGYLKMLQLQYGHIEKVALESLLNSWRSIGLPEESLYHILKIGNFLRQDECDFYKFLAIACGLLGNNLFETMVLVCELLTDESEGGSAMIPVKTFVHIYAYLARLPCTEETKSSLDNASEQSSSDVSRETRQLDERERELSKSSNDRNSDLVCLCKSLTVSIEETCESEDNFDENFDENAIETENEVDTREMPDEKSQEFETIAETKDATCIITREDEDEEIISAAHHVEASRNEQSIIFDTDKISADTANVEEAEPLDDSVEFYQQDICESVEEEEQEEEEASNLEENKLEGHEKADTTRVTSQGESEYAFEEDMKLHVHDPLDLVGMCECLAEVARGSVDEFIRKMKKQFPEPYIAPQIPGIGSTVSEERVSAVCLWLMERARRQEGLVGPRDVKHFLCPSLDDHPVHANYEGHVIHEYY